MDIIDTEQVNKTWRDGESNKERKVLFRHVHLTYNLSAEYGPLVRLPVHQTDGGLGRGLGLAWPRLGRGHGLGAARRGEGGRGRLGVRGGGAARVPELVRHLMLLHVALVSNTHCNIAG